MIKDEYYNSKGSQLFSAKGELWRYGLETGNLEPVLKPFPAFNYFFGLNSGIYFSVPTERGDLQLRYFDGKGSTKDIDIPNAEIPLSRLTSNFVESPFFSFSISDYARGLLPAKGLHTVDDHANGSEELRIGSKTYLVLTQGIGFKGPYYCSDMFRSAFLPGDRYLVFNVHCGNYDGQLLIDTVTGAYQRLPKNSRVYLTLNTADFPHYRITGGGIVVN